ncbi:MAG: hypothetical protein FWC60_07455 [Firmicutes bacterium]|nr:hypothetical protein [Bacillota bacterium]
MKDFRMKDYVIRKLNEMHNPEDKRILQEIMNDVFLPLYAAGEEKYAQLEQRVREELPLPRKQYDIYTTLLERGRSDGSHPYLRPMLDGDTRLPAITLPEIQRNLVQNQECCLYSVFYAGDYLLYKQQAENNRIYPGLIKTGQGNIAAGFKLKESRRYIDCVEKLYQIFLANQVPWVTINAPYIYKFFDVCLIKMEDMEQSDNSNADEPVEIQVSFAENEDKIRPNLIPVWNITRYQVRGDKFALPARDKTNYDHKFNLSKLGLGNGYLVDRDTADIQAVRREEDNIIVTSPVEQGLEWDLYVIIKKHDLVTEQHPYPLMSNVQTDSFAGRLLAYYGAVVKTKLELMRLFNSFSAAAYLAFDSLQLIEGTIPGESYEMNPFIKDEIRPADGKKTMLLSFTPLDRDNYLNRDLMSFLVSQVQLIYPEYNCVGKLL